MMSRAAGRVLPTILLVALTCAAARAQGLQVATHADLPPEDLADPVEALMAPGGQHVSIGRTTLDFWWVKSMPLVPGSTSVDWSAVEEGTLIGAVTLSSNYPDVHGSTMKAGIYTLRYGLQPQAGKRDGVSPYRECVLLSPAAADNSVAALGHDGAIALSRLALGASRPAAWNLDPLSAGHEAAGTTKKNRAGQISVIFSVPASRDGQDAGALKFALILVGTVPQ